MNLEVFRVLLKETQIQVDTASGGEQALRNMEKEYYDLVFMDHMMPEPDGIETFKRLQEKWEQKPETMRTVKGTPVVVLTANAVAGAREFYLSEGFQDYLSKPIDLKKLEEMLENTLPPSLLQKNPLQGGEQECRAALLPQRFDVLRKYGVDIERGLGYMGGNVETYKEILSIYFGELPDKVERLLKEARDGNMEQYRIDVHSLKSTSKSVGAMKLSALAKKHERSCMEEDIGYIHRHIDELKEECDDMISAGKEYMAYCNTHSDMAADEGGTAYGDLSD
jgi:CheY-like chemotaxis protein